MKRFGFSQEIIRFEDRSVFLSETQITPSPMTEDVNGEWVKYDEAVAALKRVEDMVPDIRIARLEKALGLVSEGRCPECGQKTDGYKFPFGAFAPEIAATKKENGIDPFTNHKFTCSKSKK